MGAGRVRGRVRGAPADRLCQPHGVVPAPAERGLRHRAHGLRDARGLAGGDGWRARVVADRRRPHPQRVSARRAGQVPDRRRGPAGGGRAAPGRPAVRAELLRCAHAPRDARGDGRDPGAAGLLREAVRAVALPDAGPGGGRGRDAGRPQPARAALPADAASDPALAAAGRGPRELLRPAGLLPGARGGAPVVGPGPGPRQLPRALAVRGLGAVRGGALAARAARRADLPHDDGPHGDVGVAPRRHRPDPPRPAARPPQGGAALLSSGGLRQGRLGAAHAARADGRPGVLRGRPRVPGKVSLREGGHRRPARGARSRERAGPEALLRPLGLRDRPAEPRLDRQHRRLPARVSARPSR